MGNKTAAKKKYSKVQLLKSKQFSNTEKYLLAAILKDEKYLKDEVKKLLDKEKKRGVK